MIITRCSYSTPFNNSILIRVEYDIPYKEVLRCVNANELLVKPSAFIGLKRQEAIDLDTRKVTKLEVKNQISLF